MGADHNTCDFAELKKRTDYTVGLLDIPKKVCYNERNTEDHPPVNLTAERVKTMNAMMNNTVCLYAYEYQQFCFSFQQGEESCFVLRTGHTGVCSAALTG